MSAVRCGMSHCAGRRGMYVYSRARRVSALPLLKWWRLRWCNFTVLSPEQWPLSLPAAETLPSSEPCQSQTAAPPDPSHRLPGSLALLSCHPGTPGSWGLSLRPGPLAGSPAPAEQSGQRTRAVSVHSHRAWREALLASFSFLFPSRFLPEAPPPSIFHGQALPDSFSLTAPEHPCLLLSGHWRLVKDTERGGTAPRSVTPSLGHLSLPQTLSVSPVAEELF